MFSAESASVGLDVPTAKKWNDELERIDRRLRPVFIAMFCMRQIATNDVVSERSVNLMSAVLTKFDNMLITVEAETAARCLLMKATRLAQLSATSDNCTISAILRILSHIYLRRATHVANNNNDVTQRLVNVHLAVTYFIAGHYQSAIRRCKRAIQHNGTQAVTSFQSLMINSDLNTVLALVTLYQCIQEKASRQQSMFSHGYAFTVQLFAYYLLIVSHSASVNCSDKSLSVVMKRYRSCLMNTMKCFPN
jgi:hypothetical protein